MASAAMGLTMTRAWNPGAMREETAAASKVAFVGRSQGEGSILIQAREAGVTPQEMGKQLRISNESAVLRAATSFEEDGAKSTSLNTKEGRVADLRTIADTHFDSMDKLDRVSFRSLQRAAMRGKATPKMTADRLESFAHKMESTGNPEAAIDMMSHACHHDAAGRQPQNQVSQTRTGSER